MKKNNLKFIIGYLTVFNILAAQNIYQFGDVVSLADQQINLPVCQNGPDSLMLADFNGAQNGGNYRILLINFFTSW
ncbi:MAG: hypothetical protein HQ528_06420 [Candidatus Marinimicrobia bacterium]|nr:hypothetical protein [Candidatus Neomarinimicrobiota bacterium]